MSIFKDTTVKAISNYRAMLRKYLPQAERVSKLSELNLKNPRLYENEIALYHTAHAIVADVERNLNSSTKGYYSYSGVGNFARYLKDFLVNYYIDGDRVVHRAQKASRALISAIQLIAANTLDDHAREKLIDCNQLIASLGSDEQKDLHKNTLLNLIHQQSDGVASFYRSILNHFQQIMEGDAAQAA